MPFYYESMEDVPEDERSEFVESEFEGRKVYQHKQFVSLANALASEKEGRRKIASKFDEYEKAEQDRIEREVQARLEQAKKDGKSDEVETIWKQKVADADKRAADAEEHFKSQIEAMAQRQSKAVAGELSSLAPDERRPAFKRLIEGMVKVDPLTGEETYFDDAGNATSLGRDAWINEVLKKSPVFAPLLLADVPSSGGGFANGSKGGNATGKKPEDYTEQERVQLYRENPDKFRQLFQN